MGKTHEKKMSSIPDIQVSVERDESTICSKLRNHFLITTQRGRIWAAFVFCLIGIDKVTNYFTPLYFTRFTAKKIHLFQNNIKHGCSYEEKTIHKNGVVECFSLKKF